MPESEAMEPRWGEPPWRRARSLPASEPPERCEVAIVGGGVTGLATALELARRGVDVAVLEAGRVGDGASGRSGGIALEGTSYGALPGADDCLAALVRVLDREAIQCDLRLDGCWELAHTSSGGVLWRDGRTELRIAASVPGGTLDPGALVSGLARAACDRGARICEGVRVRAVERDAVRVDVDGAPSVLAAGAYAGHGLALAVRSAEHIADAIAEGRPLPGWGRAELALAVPPV